ncbi:MAG: CoA transferase [Sphingobium sp.]|nr:CoA transferase [Sphingobium sp.]
MGAPLEGLKVVELARILAGPWAGQILADLGADVLKLESPDGDDTRRWGPPFIDRGDGEQDAAYFHATNRCKRSEAADFTTPQGQARGPQAFVAEGRMSRSYFVARRRPWPTWAVSGPAPPSNPASPSCSTAWPGQDEPWCHPPRL